MSKKQILILWIIAGTLTTALAVVRSKQSKSPDSVTKFQRGDKLVNELKTEAVAKVVISDHAHTTTLSKGESAWTIAERQEFSANFPKLAKAISALLEVEIAHAFEAGPIYNPRFGMDDSASEANDHGTRIQLLDNTDQELFSVTLGKQSSGGGPPNPMGMRSAPAGGGRYIRSSADPDSVYVIATQLLEFTANPAAWLAEGFIQIQSIKSITLRAPGDETFEPWTLTRENAQGDFTMEGLAEGEEMNTSTISGMKKLFNNTSFADVVETETITSDGDQSNARQSVITTFDGFTYTLNLTPKKNAEEAQGDNFNPSAENYFLTFSVTAQLEEARSKAEDETEEEAKMADTAFAALQKMLTDKLASEQKLQARAFEIAKWGTNALLKTRADLVLAAVPETPQPPAPAAVSPPFQIPFAPPQQ